MPLGIPHSVLLGRIWPNPEDPSEPYWLPDDVATALAWRSHEARRCQRCGSHPAEWPKDERETPPFTPYAVRCRGCESIGRHRREIPETAELDGVEIRLRPYDPDRELDEAMEADERRFARFEGIYAVPSQRIAPTAGAASPSED